MVRLLVKPLWPLPLALALAFGFAEHNFQI